jgi:hypothetical protein
MNGGVYNIPGRVSSDMTEDVKLRLRSTIIGNDPRGINYAWHSKLLGEQKYISIHTCDTYLIMNCRVAKELGRDAYQLLHSSLLTPP